MSTDFSHVDPNHAKRVTPPAILSQLVKLLPWRKKDSAFDNETGKISPVSKIESVAFKETLEINLNFFLFLIDLNLRINRNSV